MSSVSTYRLTDHLCRHCGTGRVLLETGGGPGDGNAVYTCANCGQTASGLSEGCLCWCGQIVRRCGLPFETRCVRSGDTLSAGWHLRNQFYGLSVWWRYAPGTTTDPPDKALADVILHAGETA